MLPKKGRTLPNGTRIQNGAEYAAAIAAALRTELGGSHQATKTVMKWTGASERTVKNWLAGTCGPSGHHLISIIRNSDHALRIVLQAAGRGRAATLLDIGSARDALSAAIAAIDVLLAAESQDARREDGSDFIQPLGGSHDFG